MSELVITAAVGGGDQQPVLEFISGPAAMIPSSGQMAPKRAYTSEEFYKLKESPLVPDLNLSASFGDSVKRHVRPAPGAAAGGTAEGSQALANRAVPTRKFGASPVGGGVLGAIGGIGGGGNVNIQGGAAGRGSRRNIGGAAAAAAATGRGGGGGGGGEN
ncbi:hypothetical protein GQ42DRAFT_153574 [Ramicandelaber brevisporus]|nr:hypothetical protein GQ42DRAFT_153574 [Ramicandelaber brevisporus]